MRNPKTKKIKKPRKRSLAAIKRKLFLLTSQICRKGANDTCAVCGQKKGYLYNGKPQRVEAHHIFSRDIKDSPMKWDNNNLICVCTLHHKTGPFSCHKNGIWFAEWLRTNDPDKYKYILDHCEDRVDLNNREYLENLEEKLINDLKELGD